MVKSFAQMCCAYGRGHGSYIISCRQTLIFFRGTLILRLLTSSTAWAKFCKLGKRILENMVKYFALMCFAYGLGHGSYIYFVYQTLIFFPGALRRGAVRADHS